MPRFVQTASTLMALAVLGAVSAGAQSPGAESHASSAGGTTAATVPVQRVVLDTVKAVEIGGGFGSSMSRDPAEGTRFYLLSDRGPNVDRPNADEKGFAIPSYAPRIGLFRLEGQSLVLVSVVQLKDESGKPLTGLPNPSGPGSTGEVALTLDGQPLQPDPRGVDTEGLAALPDGTFWVSDEYGPYLLHVAADGKTLERLSPFAGGSRSLPSVLGLRRPNRGMEGLAYVRQTGLLVGLMQSPLDNPKAAGRKSVATRLLTFDPTSGATHQYVYLLEWPENRTSEIAALSAASFLVVEFDGNLPNDPSKPSRLMAVYKIDLIGATDVGDPGNGPKGKLFDGKTLEELSSDELQAAGIRPVSKSLAVDLLAPAYAYSHDKPEGLVAMGDSMIAISNDDDFGITSDGQGGMAPKRTASGQVDRGEVLFIRLNP